MAKSRYVRRAKVIRTSSSSSSKKRNLPPPIRGATEKAYKILQDLAAGKAGKKHQKEAQKSLAKLKFVQPTSGSFERFTKKEAKRLTRQILSPAPLATQRGRTIRQIQTGKIKSKNGFYDVEGKIFASKRAAETYLISKQKAIPRAFITPKDQLANIRRAIDIKVQKLVSSRDKQFLNYTLSKIEIARKTQLSPISLAPGMPRRPIIIIKNQPPELRKILSKMSLKERQEIIKYNIAISKNPNLISQLEKAPTKKEQKLMFEIKSRTKAGEIAGKVVRFGAVQAALFSLGAARGYFSAAQVVRHPIETASGIRLALRTKGVKGLVKEELRILGVDPAGFAGEMRAFSSVFRVLGSAAKATPLAKAISREVFILKVPKAKRFAVRAILRAIDAQKKIKPLTGLKLKDLYAMGVEELTKAELKSAVQAMIKTDSVLFGSGAAKITSKGRVKGQPHDLDFATKNPDKFMQVFISGMWKTPQRGVKYTRKGGKIYRISGSKKQFIMDVKGFDRVIPRKNWFTRRGKLPVAGFGITTKGVQQLKKIKQVTNQILKLKSNKKLSLKGKAKRLKALLKQLKKATSGFKVSELPVPTREVLQGALELTTGKIIKVEGLRMIGFSEQTLRKGLGTLQTLIEKEIRRAKDPQAFLESLQIQLRTLKSSKPKTPFGRIAKRSRIKKIEPTIKLLKSKAFLKLLAKPIKETILSKYPLVGKINAKLLKFAKKTPLKFLWKRKKYQSKFRKKTINKAEIKGQGDFHHIDKKKDLGVFIPETWHKRWHMINNGVISGKNTQFYKLLRMRSLKKTDLSKLRNIMQKVKGSSEGKVIKQVKRTGKKPKNGLSKQIQPTQGLAKNEFYHGTAPSSVESIKKGGLITSDNSGWVRNAVFLTKDIRTAKWFGGGIYKKSKVLKVKLTDAQMKKAKSQGGITKADLKQTKGSEFIIQENISPKQITVLKSKQRIRTQRLRTQSSKLARSRLPKRKLRSRLPSKLPKRRKASKLPKKRRSSKIPSKVPTRKRPSKLPSKVPSKQPSKLPSKLPSRLPSRLPSKIPSRIPSKLPSRLPSKLPKRIPKKFIKKIIKMDKEKKKKLIKKSIQQAKATGKRIYLPDLIAALKGERAVGKARAGLIKKGRIFTGFETRKIVRR